eukprot:TRINITY_DN10285_c0_g1_i1.p1 TRINITY_DN10285_c0_g1~~TRINITY_DN10285_c0_g1_i1.p1  ORF type:complete len:658 (-),score=139.38 TRINITY_DN10285_c0_g1_i1:420-2393(-)
MAVEGEEADYESDPEEALLPLTMRRREASDDEDGEGDEREKPVRVDPRVVIGSDGESDGQGGAPGYEDEESEIEEEEEEIEEEEFEERVSEGDNGAEEVEVPAVLPESGGDLEGFRETNQGEEEKKENEPFAVPTAGAFYMHDDRFRDNGGGGGRGRQRRTPGGRKLWESKDNRAWVHDRFEEMNLHEAHYNEERASRSRFRGGRGKNRVMDRGYVRGNRSKAYDDSNNQNRAPKVIRGRGPRRYQPPVKNNNEIPGTQNKKYGKSLEPTSNTSSGTVASQNSNLQPGLVLPRKHVFASSLSSASPPFYPSGSSSQDISITHKRQTQTGITSRNLPSPMMEENTSASQSSALLRGKTIIDPICQDRLYMDDSNRPISGKPLTNLQLQPSGSSSAVITTQSPQTRVQGRGLTSSGQLNYQQTSSLNQVNRGSVQTQQRPVQSALRASPQQLGQRPGNGTQPSSPRLAPSVNLSEVGEVESSPGSSKSKTALVGKGKTNIQGSGRGSFMYSGAQVIGANGAMGVAHGDQNFPGTPALLPVMQFAGQNHGGLGVPAVGMALPGYVAQPQLGFGNNEMTWVPVLAGAAGALGATYCSPYIAVDGSYYARPSGQSSSNVSRETTTNKPSNVLKPPQRSELVNEEYGLRQNKPRRYSEMNFGH